MDVTLFLVKVFLVMTANTVSILFSCKLIKALPDGRKLFTKTFVSIWMVDCELYKASYTMYSVPIIKKRIVVHEKFQWLART